MTRIIRNVKEARKCLESYGISPATGHAGKSARTKQLSRDQKFYLRELGQGTDFEVGHFREVLGTAIFDAITANVADNELQAGYGEIPDTWKLIAKIRTAKDYKSLQSTRFSGLANMPTVAQNASYKFLAMSDEAVTYTPTKRGALCGISLEAYTSDAIGAFKEMANEMGKAAKNTLNEFVIGTLFDDNPTCDYDSTALFVSGHSNHSGTNTGLTLASVAAGITAMMTQTGPNSQIIYPYPTGLLCKPENLILGSEIARSQMKITGNTTPIGEDNGIAAFGLSVDWSPHIDNATTDSGAYIISNIKPVEVAFVGGRQAPDIFREPDDTGMAFTNDAVVWKIRHSYGGDAIDHRGVYVITDA